jgi:hypothetical protein
VARLEEIGLFEVFYTDFTEIHYGAPSYAWTHRLLIKDRCRVSYALEGATVSQDCCDIIAERLNTRPRKRPTTSLRRKPVTYSATKPCCTSKLILSTPEL